ncbi:MAG: 4'-phosphopantetheinyl transferase superfamily protein [Leptolyngbya sp. SIO4C1]|nr:4'-phosphopantetheinyl transferase superfamily protein [Leptolyngbya sp. SIO4C1]
MKTQQVVCDFTPNSSQVHLWEIPLQLSNISHYWDCLSEVEQSRANRFRFERDRHQFVHARGSLRHILSGYTQISPDRLEFLYGDYGKPQLAAQPDLQFNLSHSAGQALCAIAYQRRVGVDLEQVRLMSHFQSLSQRCLTPLEAETLAPLSQPEAQRQFLQYWTCKEAYLKAIGQGLTQSLQTVEVQLSGPPQLLQVPEAGDWALTILQSRLPDDFVGAVVSEGQVPVERFEWNLSDSS